MRKNAFTLIELLAVIVILAIIALIATPIILGIINDSKEESNKRSIENYAKAVENAIAQYQLSGKYLGSQKLKTTDGKTFEGTNFKVQYDGNVVCEVIEIYESGNIFLDKCEVNNQEVKYTYGVEGEFHLAEKNVRPVTESKTGIVPILENGNLKVGSEFKIKVSDKIKDENGEVAEYSFFVLSNSEDGKYVNLIAQKNIAPDGTFTSDSQNGDEWNPALSFYPSYAKPGPQNAYKYLNTATKKWINIPIIENFVHEDEGHKQSSAVGYQKVETKLDLNKGKYITTIIPFSPEYGNSVSYENMRTRLPYRKEITKNTSCVTYVSPSDEGKCPLWMVNYLQNTSNYTESDGKINGESNNDGYWTLDSRTADSMYVYAVKARGFVGIEPPHSKDFGIRPVITILKSDLLRVMQ